MPEIKKKTGERTKKIAFTSCHYEFQRFPRDNKVFPSAEQNPSVITQCLLLYHQFLHLFSEPCSFAFISCSLIASTTLRTETN